MPKGGDNTANKRIEIRIDRETFYRIMAKHPDLKVSRFLTDQFMRLEHETPEEVRDAPLPVIEIIKKRPKPEPEGVSVKCSRCGYSWIYTGINWRVKCHRCGSHVRTGVRFG